MPGTKLRQLMLFSIIHPHFIHRFQTVECNEFGTCVANVYREIHLSRFFDYRLQNY